MDHFFLLSILVLALITSSLSDPNSSPTNQFDTLSSKIQALTEQVSSNQQQFMLFRSFNNNNKEIHNK